MSASPLGGPNLLTGSKRVFDEVQDWFEAPARLTPSPGQRLSNQIRPSFIQAGAGPFRRQSLRNDRAVLLQMERATHAQDCVRLVAG